jgi:hypothetical protein
MLGAWHRWPTWFTDIDLSVPMDLRHLGAIRKGLTVAGITRLKGVDHHRIAEDRSERPRESRVWPIDLSAVQTRSDHIDVTLPPGYVVDELPEPVSLDTDFASYHSVVTADATSLHYSREYTVKQLQLDASRYDEATSADLKKK